jgi:amino acid transporter
LASAKPTVFVREATGLVREVGAWSSFMAVFFLVTGGVVVLELGTMYTAPGANWPLALFVAFLPSLLAGGMFTMIGSSLPRAGADYVFTTRATKSIIGFVNYWGLNIAYILNIGIFAYYGSSYLGYFLSGLGSFYNNTGLANQGANLVGPGPTFVIAVLIIIVFGAMSVMRPKNVWRIIFWVGILSLVATVIMFVAMAGITSDSFQGTYNSFMANSNSTYSSVIQLGGITMPTSTLAATGAALPFAWFAYTWYNLSLGWTGELKNVKRSLPITIIVALIAIAIYYILFSFLVVRAFGQNFLNNWSFLAYSGNTPIAGIGNFVPFFLLIAYKAPWIYVAAFLALWIPTVFEFPAVIISQTRYLFAWAFDRILPDRFASVSDRFHTPIYATVLVLVGGIIGSAFMATLPNPAEFATLTFAIFSFGFIIPAIAAVVFPYLRRDMFQANFSTKRFVLPVLSWLGLGTAVYLIYSTYLANASGSLPLDNLAAALFGTIYSLGIIVYVISYFWNKRRGLPLSLVFKEIPPE